MTKKATAKKVTGIVMATRGPKDLHRTVTVAAKADGITLGRRSCAVLSCTWRR